MKNKIFFDYILVCIPFFSISHNKLIRKMVTGNEFFIIDS